MFMNINYYYYYLYVFINTTLETYISWVDLDSIVLAVIESHFARSVEIRDKEWTNNLSPITGEWTPLWKTPGKLGNKLKITDYVVSEFNIGA